MTDRYEEGRAAGIAEGRAQALREAAEVARNRAVELRDKGFPGDAACGAIEAAIAIEAKPRISRMADTIATPTYSVVLPAGVVAGDLYYSDTYDEFGWAMPDIDIGERPEILRRAGWHVYRRPYAPYAMMMRAPKAAEKP